MRSMFLCCALTLCALAHPQQSNAQVMGIGNMTCNYVLQHQGKPKGIALELAASWLRGYLGSSVAYERFALSNPGYGSQINQSFVDSFRDVVAAHCERNPLQTIQQVGNDFVDQLGGALKN